MIALSYRPVSGFLVLLSHLILQFPEVLQKEWGWDTSIGQHFLIVDLLSDCFGKNNHRPKESKIFEVWTQEVKTLCKSDDTD